MAFKAKKIVDHEGAEWFEQDSETKVLVASIDNPQYQVGLDRLRRITFKNDLKVPDGEVFAVEGEKPFHEGQCRLLAKYVLKDWKGEGITGPDGKPMQYSEDAAFGLLYTDPGAFVFVLDSAQKLAMKLDGELKDVVEKPSPGTSGKGTGQKAKKPE